MHGDDVAGRASMRAVAIGSGKGVSILVEAMSLNRPGYQIGI